jgi:hypothetical protein
VRPQEYFAASRPNRMRNQCGLKGKMIADIRLVQFKLVREIRSALRGALGGSSHQVDELVVQAQSVVSRGVDKDALLLRADLTDLAR